MEVIRDHQAHVLRPYLNEWCGGTEPPTVVTGYPKRLEAEVDVFPEGTELHDSYIHRPERTVRFLMLFEHKLSLERVELLSKNALQHLLTKEGS